MALQRFFSGPNSIGSATSVNGVVTEFATPGQPGWNIAADSLSSPTLVTAPPNAASVYAPASYTAATASVATVVQNTLGYDAQFVAYFQGAASVATVQIGVGATSPPPVVTVATSLSNTTVASYDFPAYVPTGYFYSIQVSQANAASVPSAALTIVAYPV